MGTYLTRRKRRGGYLSVRTRNTKIKFSGFSKNGADTVLGAMVGGAIAIGSFLLGYLISNNKSNKYY